MERDEPVTPASRLFLRPELDQVINCVIGLTNSIDVDVIKSEIKNSLMIKHPRFRSLVVKDRHGREHWKKTQVDLDRHVIVLDSPVGDTEEEAVNGYLADLALSSPLPADKPLWEAHLLTAHNCLIFRIHHSMGDGISLMSLLLAICRKADDVNELPSTVSPDSLKEKKKQNKKGERKPERVVLRLLKAVWFNLVFLVGFILRCLWVRDRSTTMSGGAGIELWPRKLATARFWIEDMKAVKKAIPNATINDVLFGVISSGLSRYLDTKSPEELQDGLRITGVGMVNLRKQPGLQDVVKMMENKSGLRWGNKFGMLLLPVYYRKGRIDPLDHLKRAKSMLDKKKQSLEAHFSYNIGHLLMSLFGPKVASLLNYRILCNTSFTLSNVMGPQEEITIRKNPVTFIRVTSSTLPHAITMHMVSYAGRADMQIQVAKDIIHDPEFLAKCFEDALLEMKNAAADLCT